MGNDIDIKILIEELKKRKIAHGAGFAGLSALTLAFLYMALSDDNTTLENILLISSLFGGYIEGKHFFDDSKGIKEYKSYLKDK